MTINTHAVVFVKGFDADEQVYLSYKAEKTLELLDYVFYIECIEHGGRTWDWMNIQVLDWKTNEPIESFLCDREKLVKSLVDAGFKIPKNYSLNTAWHRTKRK